MHPTKYLDTFCAYFKGNAGSLFSVLVLCFISHTSLNDNSKMRSLENGGVLSLAT